MSTADPLAAVTAIVDELGDTDVDIVDTTALYERLRAALNVPTPTAADRTPATDSERDERLRTLAALLLRHGHVDWDAHDARTVANAVMEGWAAPLLAEQAATIERLDLAAQETDWPAVSRALAVARALGSQRTEGQG